LTLINHKLLLTVILWVHSVVTVLTSLCFLIYYEFVKHSSSVALIVELNLSVCKWCYFTVWIYLSLFLLPCWGPSVYLLPNTLLFGFTGAWLLEYLIKVTTDTWYAH